LAFCLLPGSALADEGHCHNRGPANQLVDAEDLDTRQACDEEGGIWFQHRQHCHITSKDGKITELLTVRSQKACTAAGGHWMEHDARK
jgi:hypothetical protein